MTVWTKPFVHNDRFFEATFLKRPDRDGLEASVHLRGRLVRVRDPKHSERHLIEQLKVEIDRVVSEAA